MDTPYSNRELNEKFDSVHGKLDEMRDASDKSFTAILEQTTKHNGRMKKLELYVSYLQGAMAVVVIAIVPILGWVLYQVVSFGNLNDKISIGIDKALSEYEVKLK